MSAETLLGLGLIAAGAVAFLYMRNGASPPGAGSSASASAAASSFDPFAASGGGAFSSPVFGVITPASGPADQGATGVNPLYGDAPGYDNSVYAPGQITTTNLMPGTSQPVATASLKSDFGGGGFWDSIFSGLGSIFGGTAQAATPSAPLAATGGGMSYTPSLPAAGGGVSRDVDILARTIFGEARSEGLVGMQAVANVVVNRSRKSPKYGWPRGIADVCLQRLQFSCWNANDPNRARITSVTTAEPKFRTCIDVAQKAVAGTLPDLTGNADHYFADYIATPAWAKGKTPTTKIGHHIFLRLV